MNKYTMKLADEFERTFVEVVIETLSESEEEPNHSEFGRRAFGGEGGPEYGPRKWRAIRTERKKRQSVSISDAYRMALALDVPIEYLIHKTVQIMKDRNQSSKKLK